MSEIKIQRPNIKLDIPNWGSTPKGLSEKELKKLKKEGKIHKCPTRKAPGSKNARWGQCE